MKTIAEENERESSRSICRWRRWRRWVTVGCAAALLLLFLPLLPIGKGPRKSAGVALLAQSVQAMSSVQTVHITGRIRTLPNDNFELIGAQYDFVPIEIWREYTNPPRWRVEKAGRTVVMNGQSALLYISAINSAMTGSPQADLSNGCARCWTLNLSSKANWLRRARRCASHRQQIERRNHGRVAAAGAG